MIKSVLCVSWIIIAIACFAEFLMIMSSAS